MPHRLRFAFAGFGGFMVIATGARRSPMPLGGVGNSIEFGRRIGESGRGSMSAFGVLAFVTIAWTTDLRAALFVEYACADSFGVAIGTAAGLSLSSFYGTETTGYVGLPVRLTWYAPASRGEHLHSVFVATEFEPDAATEGRWALAFHVFGSVGYVIH